MHLCFNATEEDLKIFLEEAHEQLQVLDDDLITLEKTGANSELLQEIFRVAHTLKGSSATIGHNRMAQLTHAMESVLDGLRRGTIEVSSPLIDVLLECLDALSILTGEVANSQVSDYDLDPLVARLLNISQRVMDGPEVTTQSRTRRHEAALDESQRAAVLEHEALGDNVYQVEVVIDPNALLPAARCTQILLEIGTLADVLCSVPSLAELEAGVNVDFLQAICATRTDVDQIVNVVSSIPDVMAARVEPFREEGQWSAPGITSALDIKVGNRDADRTGEGVIDRIQEATDKTQGDMGHLAASTVAQQARVVPSNTVRIDVKRLDKLMNLVGELVLDNTRLAESIGRLRAGVGDADIIERLSETSLHISRIADELQQEIMRSRMVPVGNIFSKFPRMVRKLAQEVGKDIDLVIKGQETELDRSVIEVIVDPLIHLLRNAVDHGIEMPGERLSRGKSATGTIRLSAFHQEDHIVLVVEDDGCGMDRARLRAKSVETGLLTQEASEHLTDEEALELIFAPGFSTATKVSEVSGRGVGMDIVRTNIERLNGSITLATIEGQGSRFTIQLPLTLAIIQALLVSVADNVYAIPLTFVTEVMRVNLDQVHHIRRKEAVLLRDQVLPLLRLRQVFSVGELETGDVTDSESNNERRKERNISVVAVRHGGRQVGLVVDALIGQQEVVIKALGEYVGRVRVVSGATILGDGRVGLIVDVPGLVQVAMEEKMGESEKVNYCGIGRSAG